MSLPTFAISVPIGSWHPFLPACLESLICQDTPLEVAILDASGDARVLELVDRVADRFGERLAYRRHGPDQGQSDAIAEGWANISGDILGWLNADDILYPDALDRASKSFLNDLELDAVYGHSTIIDDAGAFTGYHWAVEPPGPRLLESGIVSQPSCFFRRSATDSINGLNKDLHYTMDWDLWIRLYTNGHRFTFIDSVLSMVLWGSDTKTSSFNKERQAELLRLIRSHSPKAKQKKIFRSFAIQNALDRIRPRLLKDLIVRLFVRGRKVINGLSADGLILENFHLPVCHYQPHAVKALKIEVNDCSQVAQIAVDGKAIATNQVSTSTLICPLENSLPPGKIANLVIVSPKGCARLRHVALLSDLGQPVA